jgi:prephenate dehydrogenase
VALWTDLLARNREALLPWIDALSTRIGELRAAIAGNDAEALRALLIDGRDGRTRVIP